ncbi:alpha/beta hydrolase fold domain-containing protein [Streptomyces sp. RPT161]|uniref:alpha/beta hydrolase fold domain-containing protein n=1 Tax=Streptomyces sp. RPT161 TaxID=3015993 RepID=UPI0022B92D88|nr:alpha/beta hydrolase [Streptomyces sp. RPT161]
MDTVLDPELAAALATMPRSANGSLMDLSDIPALREMLRAVSPLATSTPDDPRVTVETLRIPRDDRSLLDVVLFRPANADRTRPAMLWFHAGGQILGTAHDDVEYHTALALALDCVLAVVDYRLAPETPAPGAADDGYLAYTHLCENAAEHRIDPHRIGIAGASGGGAPAAATALMLRDRQDARPCFLSLSYPMLDDRNETPSSFEVTDLGIWDRRENLLAWAAVLGDRVGDPALDPYSAPARATDLTGMPDTFIAAAQFDVFRDEDMDFARRLITAGVPVELHLYARAFHAWDRFAPKSTLARTFEHTWHDFLRRHMHG